MRVHANVAKFVCNFVITIFTLNASASRIKPLKVKFIMPLNQLIYKRQPAAVHSRSSAICNTQRSEPRIHNRENNRNNHFFFASLLIIICSNRKCRNESRCTGDMRAASFFMRLKRP